ncbi:dihydrofolate reductase family protein [Massilia sp. NR 4-1]|uniref:dihydrofolate reductase family protein n=1 Tax=Massilia sp. NR 4-1 TaxID=1678028 RepID=UPI0006A285E6|nr:dihydrofolate reductase family protein [Massilia sp. NR 4-1]AKU20320.1 hypothetical protein ACZ75_01015 [Massilia sp. NR 4-1]
MRKLVLAMSMSADGFVGGLNGEMDWLAGSLDADATAWLLDGLWQADAHLMGSEAFRDMAPRWAGSRAALAAPLNAIPKIVFTRGGVALPEDCGSWSEARVVKGGLRDEILRLKTQQGKRLLAHGGAGFAQSLVQHGLVDEYQLMVHPVVLGSGLPLFPIMEQPLQLKLLNARCFPSGAMAHVYRPA